MPQRIRSAEVADFSRAGRKGLMFVNGRVVGFFRRPDTKVTE
jgi:hypothetical protein